MTSDSAALDVPARLADAYQIVTTLRAQHPEVASIAVGFEATGSAVLYYEGQQNTTRGIIRGGPTAGERLSGHAAMIVVPAMERLAGLLRIAAHPLPLERIAALHLGLRIGWDGNVLDRLPAGAEMPEPKRIMTLSFVPVAGKSWAMRHHEHASLMHALLTLNRIAAFAAPAPECLFGSPAAHQWLVRIDCRGIDDVEVPGDDAAAAAAAAATVALLLNHQVGSLPDATRMRILRIARLEVIEVADAAVTGLGAYLTSCMSHMDRQA